MCIYINKNNNNNIHTTTNHHYYYYHFSRDITLALDVAGSEVEWTLGYALAEVTKLVSI